MVDTRLDMIIIDTGVSASGKYHIFLGSHYNGREQCYDVAALNLSNGEITKRHYTGPLAKERAVAEWNEFSERMKVKHHSEEDEPPDPMVVN